MTLVSTDLTRYGWHEKDGILHIYNGGSMLPPTADESDAIIVEYIVDASTLNFDEYTELPLNENQWQAVLSYIKSKLYESIDVKMSKFHMANKNRNVYKYNKRMKHIGQGVSLKNVNRLNTKRSI